MQVKRFTTASELATLKSQWNRLAAGTPLLSYQWLATWWRHCAQPDERHCGETELYVLGVFDHGDQLVGLAPWYVRRLARGGRVIHFLGSGEVCTDYLTVLCQPGRETEVAAKLAGWLLGDRASQSDRVTGRSSDGWDRFELDGIDAQDLMMQQFIERLSQRGALVYSRPGPNCWRLQLPGTWDEYLATFSKRNRKRLRALERDFFGTGRAVWHTVQSDEQLGPAWEIFTDLHQRRRQSLGEPGCFSSPRFAAFHREVAGRLLEAAWLRLHWLELDGRPVAAEYHVGNGQIVYAYQSGIEPEALDQQPGRLATIAAIQGAIADGYRALDLMRGDEPYKALWRAEPRRCLEIAILPGKTSDHLRFGMWRAGDSVKSWLKAGLDLADQWKTQLGTRPPQAAPQRDDQAEQPAAAPH